jgi:transposase
LPPVEPFELPSRPHGRKQAIEGLAGVFSVMAEAAEGASASEMEKFDAKIGQLVVARNFLARAFGR